MGGTCCFQLLTMSQGSYIIALLDIIGTIAVIFGDVYLLVGVAYRPEGFPEELITLGSFVIILGLGYLIACSFLVYGFRKYSPRFCKPWLVINYILLVLFALGIFVFFPYLMNLMASYPPRMRFLVPIVEVGAFSLRVFLVFVVQDFVDEMKRIREDIEARITNLLWTDFE